MRFQFPLALLLVASLATANSASPLTVQLSSEASASSPWQVRVTLRNTGASSVSVLSWFSPLDSVLRNPLAFAVTDVTDEHAPLQLPYQGMVAKMAAPTESSFIVLEPEAETSTVVDLAQGYVFEAGHAYDVGVHAEALAFVAEEVLEWQNLHEAKRDMQLASMETSDRVRFVARQSTVTPQERNDARGVGEAKQSHTDVGDMQVMYTEQNCLGHSSDNAEAVANLRAGLDVAWSYVDAQCRTDQYTEWFGTYTSSRYNEVKETVQTCRELFDDGDYKLYCNHPDCPDSTFAYVYPTDTGSSRTIYLCSAYFAASEDLTWDSKPGTLHHECSHFNDMGSTSDYVYGRTDARSLALSNPGQAVNNADSNEYFVEQGINLCNAASIEFTDTCSASNNMLNEDYCGAGSVDSTTASQSSSSSFSTDCGSSASSPDVFYRFTAPRTGSFVIEITAASFDTVLMLVDETCSTTVACDDDGGTGSRSKLTASVTKGNVYAVRVSGHNGESGTFTLSYNTNQDCSWAATFTPSSMLTLLLAALLAAFLSL